jgi:hypothetical protein
MVPSATAAALAISLVVTGGPMVRSNGRVAAMIAARRSDGGNGVARCRTAVAVVDVLTAPHYMI